MFIKGKCAIYIDKNLRVYENSTGIFVLCIKLIPPLEGRVEPGPPPLVVLETVDIAQIIIL